MVSVDDEYPFVLMIVDQRVYSHHVRSRSEDLSSVTHWTRTDDRTNQINYVWVSCMGFWGCPGRTSHDINVVDYG